MPWKTYGGGRGFNPISANLLSELRLGVLVSIDNVWRLVKINEDWEQLVSFLPDSWQELADDAGGWGGCAKTNWWRTCCVCS